jgi:tRNA G10  N-methylase Trm11
MNQRTNVARKIDAISKEEEKRYEIRLTSSLDVARFFIMQGDAFHGHDESSTFNKGTFKEMVDWYKDKVEIVKDAYVKRCKKLHNDISTLILLVATASVERIFSNMSIVKTDLRNKIGDEWLNDLMICYTEKGDI